MNQNNTNAGRITFRNGSVERLLKDLANPKYNPMTEKQEEEAFLDRTKNRKRIIECNLRLIFKIAKEYATTASNTCDYFSQGVMGLMDSIDNFDPTLGFKFDSFCQRYIRSYITTYISMTKTMVRSTNNMKYGSRVRKFEEKYFAENGKYPTDDEILKHLEKFGIKVKSGNTVEIHGSKMSSLNDYINDDESDTVEDGGAIAMSTASCNLVEDTIEDEDRKEKVRVLMNCKTLKPREKEVLVHMFFDGWSKERIAGHYNKTEEWVRQNTNNALEKLRKYAKSFM